MHEALLPQSVSPGSSHLKLQRRDLHLRRRVYATQGTISDGTGSPRAIGTRTLDTSDLISDTSRETLVPRKSGTGSSSSCPVPTVRSSSLILALSSPFHRSPHRIPSSAAPSASPSVLREPGFSALRPQRGGKNRRSGEQYQGSLGNLSGRQFESCIMSSGGAPCGACKFLRRKCAKGCVFAPYFDSDEGAEHFAAVHKIFGASNVSKLLLHIPIPERCEAVVTIAYEAQARLRDPVYGCVAHIFALQQQVASLQAELTFVQAQLASRLSSGSPSTSINIPVMSSSSYSQHPHQFPAQISPPCHPIPQPYDALLSHVKAENACDFANSMDSEFSQSPSDNSSSPQMEVLQRCSYREGNGGEYSGDLQALAHALLLRG